MEIKISIQTPKGEAKKSQERLKPFLLGRRIHAKESYVNEENSTVYWVVEAGVRDIVRIRKNIDKFDAVMRKVLDQKKIKQTIQEKLTSEDQENLREMLKQHTKVEVITKATAEELVEADKSFWQRMKDRFKRM